MAETADQIKSRIDFTRARLGQDLNALEYSLKRATDWRVQFRRRPWAILGAVLAVSLLCGLAAARR
jgi:hypothetical protein